MKIYLLIVNNKNTKKKVWKLFKVNNKSVDDVLVSFLLTLIIFHTFSVYIIDFEQLNNDWDVFIFLH